MNKQHITYGLYSETFTSLTSPKYSSRPLSTKNINNKKRPNSSQTRKLPTLTSSTNEYTSSTVPRKNKKSIQSPIEKDRLSDVSNQLRIVIRSLKNQLQ